MSIYLKKFAAVFAALVLFAALLPVHTLATELSGAPDIASRGAVLIDADTGQVLYGKNMHERMAPASMTKVMTALLVVENADPDEVLTVSASAIDIDEPDSSGIDLEAGERLTVRDALYALMLPSANDAANVLAEHVAGSQEKFAEMMTQKAQQIGALDTRYANAHGLDEAGHYTTPYDMALITRYAMQNERFMEYFTAVEYTMAPTNLYPEERVFNTPQYMKRRDTNYYYEPVLGGKTGFTDDAMYTLTSGGRLDGRTLVTVVMYAEIRAETFWDTQALLEFGFYNFSEVTVSLAQYAGMRLPIMENGEEVGGVAYTVDRDAITALIHHSVDPEAIMVNANHEAPLTRESDFSCTVTIEAPIAVPGVPTLLGSVELEAEVDLPPLVLEPEARESNFTEMLSGWFAKIKNDVFTIFLIAGCVITGFLLVCVGIRGHNLKKRRRIRQQKLRQQRLREQARRPQQNTAQYGGVRPHVTASSHRNSSRYPTSTRR